MVDKDTCGDDDLRLLKRFDKERDNQAVATEFVTKLRKLMLIQFRRRWPRMKDWDDIEGGALLRLVEWRHDGRLKLWKDPLEVLAEQLVAAEVEKEQNYKRNQRQLRKVVTVDPTLASGAPVDIERQLVARDLLAKTLELIERLPTEYAEALRAVIDEQSEDGPRMEEALGITKQAAQARLKRARVALLNLAMDEGLADDLTDFLESEG